MKGLVIAVLAFEQVGYTAMLCDSLIGDNKSQPAKVTTTME